MRAGNAVTVCRHRIVARIDGEYADRHEHNRGNHQNGKKSGMLGGHIRKLFRLGRTKFFRRAATWEHGDQPCPFGRRPGDGVQLHPKKVTRN